MNTRHRALALFHTLLAVAVITGASTSVHNGATLLALLFLAGAMTIGIRIAILDERARATDGATALAEGSSRPKQARAVWLRWQQVCLERPRRFREQRRRPSIGQHFTTPPLYRRRT